MSDFSINLKGKRRPGREKKKRGRKASASTGARAGRQARRAERGNELERGEARKRLKSYLKR